MNRAPTRLGFGFGVALFVALLGTSTAQERDPAAEAHGTAFAIAIEREDADKVKAMLADGVSPDTRIVYGAHAITPLMKAASDGATEIAELLLAAGANVNGKASDSGETALMNAVTRERVEFVRLLIKAGADVKPKSIYGFSAFTSAVASGNREIVDILLAAGADIESEAHGLTALMLATGSGKPEMIRHLVKAGAKINYASTRENSGQTALLTAIYGGQIEAVRTLIELGANVNTRTKDGDTPLKAARKGDQEDVIALLKAAGAKK